MPHGENTNTIAVFFTEQGQRASGNRLIGGHFLDPGGRVLADDRVDLGLHGVEFVGGHRAVMREVEAQPFSLDQ